MLLTFRSTQTLIHDLGLRVDANCPSKQPALTRRRHALSEKRLHVIGISATPQVTVEAVQNAEAQLIAALASLTENYRHVNVVCGAVVFTPALDEGNQNP